jgi:hypothetical protein
MTWIRLPAPARCQSIRRGRPTAASITFAVPLPGPFEFLTSPRRSFPRTNPPPTPGITRKILRAVRAATGLATTHRKTRCAPSAQRQVDSFRLVAILGSVAQEHFHHPDKSTQTKLLQSPADSIGSGPRLPQIRVARSCRDYLTQFTGTRKSGLESRKAEMRTTRLISLDIGLAPR